MVLSFTRFDFKDPIFVVSDNGVNTGKMTLRYAVRNFAEDESGHKFYIMSKFYIMFLLAKLRVLGG